MAKKAVVTIKGVGAAQANALKFLNNVAKDKRILDSIGKDLALQIKLRTQGRQGAATGDNGEQDENSYKQKPILNVTAEARKLYAKVYNTSPFALPKRSNLTLTGQLLDSIKSSVVSASSTIIIFLKKERRNRKVPNSILQEEYDKIIDKDRNATNSKRRNPKDKDKITAIFLLKNQKDKDNVEIKNDLEKQGRKFLFMSDKLQTMLEVKLRQQIAKQLSLYNKVKRKLTT